MLRLLFLLIVSVLVVQLYPLVAGLGTVVPGAVGTDVWNALAGPQLLSSWEEGTHTSMLNAPNGTHYWPADPIMTIVLSVVSGDAAVSYSLWVVLCCVVLVAAVSLLVNQAEHWTHWRGWFAGAVFAQSSIWMSMVHNGSSEMLLFGLAVLAMAAWNHREWPMWLRGLLLFVGALTSPYAAVMIACWCGLTARGQLPLLGVWLAAVSAAYGCISMVFYNESSVAIIKGSEALDQVRRTIGSVDARALLLPNVNSPDMELLMRFGEDFRHLAYVGIPLLLTTALWGRGRYWWAVALGFVLALGPVLVQDGEPLVVAGLAFPLPFWLIENAPGFSELSLVFRFALLGQLALVFLNARGVPSPLWAALVLVLVVLERPLATSYGPSHSVIELSHREAMVKLREAPAGSVMQVPVAGGTPQLYWQTLHQKPVVGQLNSSGNARSIQLLKLATEQPAIELFQRRARQLDIRYLLISDRPSLPPREWSSGVSWLETQLSPLVREPGLVILQLW